MRNRDRFRGCLIGGAAGDALGYAVEFMSEEMIFSRYGERGITEYKLRDGAAWISDDTQMTLFTATGLLTATVQGIMSGEMGRYADSVYESYLDWLKTQENFGPTPFGRHGSWLANLKAFYIQRAPGNTCMEALFSGRRGTVEKPLNNSKGCGGVMRVAPVGLYFNDQEMRADEIARIGAETAAITHGHILGWMPAAALAQIIHEVSQNDEKLRDAVLHALRTADEMWRDTEEKRYFRALIEKAVDLAAAEEKDIDAIHQLGEGWVAEETLAIAVYCALKYEHDFDRALIAAVNHRGDSDSTGAVTGNILGAKLGLGGIPEKYLENLELKDLILGIADDLWQGFRMSGEDPERRDPVWSQKYIEMSYRP